MMRDFVETKGTTLVVGLQRNDPQLETFLRNQKIPYSTFDDAELYDSSRHWSRAEKIKSRSGPALKMLQAEGRRFDLACIDGGHRRDEVMADSVGVWQLLEPGG
jgi:hypothetical protein